jgi:hypothetical protein
MFKEEFFFFEIFAILEVMWKTNIQPDRPQMRKHIACCITRDTNTYSEYVILFAFPLQQWLYERASILRHTYVACRVGCCVEE